MSNSFPLTKYVQYSQRMLRIACGLFAWATIYKWSFERPILSTHSSRMRLLDIGFEICYHFGNENQISRTETWMEVFFRTRKLQKLFDSARNLRKEYGDRGARRIMTRLAVLLDAETLSEVPTTPPDRRHQLRGDRDEQYAVDLIHPYRLVFEPFHDPLPRREDGGIDLERVTAVMIIEVIDYHPKSS